jgi:hypothetical protein
MGEIVFWTILRIVLVIPILWIAKSYIEFEMWWLISFLAIYGVIIHPAIIHYRLFEERNKDIIESTLCSTCKHFDRSAVLCMKYDKHPTVEYLPCEGFDWEPKASPIDKDIIED